MSRIRNILHNEMVRAWNENKRSVLIVSFTETDKFQIINWFHEREIFSGLIMNEITIKDSIISGMFDCDVKFDVVKLMSELDFILND